MFDTSLLPPHEKGVMWSYSRLCELPQHLQLPPSRVNTILLVVSDTYLLCAKPPTLIKRSARRSTSFFMLVVKYTDCFTALPVASLFSPFAFSNRASTCSAPFKKQKVSPNIQHNFERTASNALFQTTSSSAFQPLLICLYPCHLCDRIDEVDAVGDTAAGNAAWPAACTSHSGAHGWSETHGRDHGGRAPNKNCFLPGGTDK